MLSIHGLFSTPKWIASKYIIHQTSQCKLHSAIRKILVLRRKRQQIFHTVCHSRVFISKRCVKYGSFFTCGSDPFILSPSLKRDFNSTFHFPSQGMAGGLWRLKSPLSVATLPNYSQQKSCACGNILNHPP